VAGCPVSFIRSQSFGHNAQLAAVISSGWCRRTQSSSGPVMPGAMGLASIARSFCGNRRQLVSTLAARESAQVMASRNGSPSGPVSTSPCIWPATARPRMSTPSARETASRTASRVAVHQSAGLVSAAPGQGLRTG
jgi:hypothetical protein